MVFGMDTDIHHIQNQGLTSEQQLREVISVLAEICVHEVLNNHGRKENSHETQTNSKID